MKIAKLHEIIFDYLMEKHRHDSSFKFTMRSNDRYERLQKGYWFIGNDQYLELSFWDGKDSLSKINNIGFTILLRGAKRQVYYNLSCKDPAV